MKKILLFTGIGLGCLIAFKADGQEKSAQTSHLIHSDVSASVPQKSSPKIVSVDSMRLFKESEAGKAFEIDVKNELAQFETEFSKKRDEIITERESLKKQAAVLTEETFAKKQAEIESLERDVKLTIEREREKVSASIQRRQMKIREDQLSAAKDTLTKRGWDFVIDSHAPGILAASENVDETDKVLAHLNKKYKERNMLAGVHAA